jgi:hypothetical protein
MDRGGSVTLEKHGSRINRDMKTAVENERRSTHPANEYRAPWQSRDMAHHRIYRSCTRRGPPVCGASARSISSRTAFVVLLLGERPSARANDICISHALFRRIRLRRTNFIVVYSLFSGLHSATAYRSPRESGTRPPPQSSVAAQPSSLARSAGPGPAGHERPKGVLCRRQPQRHSK